MASVEATVFLVDEVTDFLVAVIKVAPALEGVVVKVAVFPEVIVVNLVTGLIEA